MARSHAGIVSAMVALVVLAASIPAGAQRLTLELATQKTLDNNQQLKALDQMRAASREAVKQAGAYLNPELETDTENFGETEFEVVLTQPIMTGGRRRAAVDVASWDAAIADLEYESAIIGLKSELLRRYVVLLASRKRLSLIDSTIVISNRSIEAVRRLVEAGATMEVDLLRAELERDEYLLERAGLERDVYEAEVKLSELWGGDGLGYDGIDGSVSTGAVLPSQDRLEAALESHPDVRIMVTRARLADAERVQAKSERVPELAVSAGYLRNNEFDENTVKAGLSFSLPILNRYGSAILEKEHEQRALEHEARQHRVERAVELTALYSAYDLRGRELDAIAGEVLERATSIHRSLNEFYLMGKVGLLDVLAARAHLLDLHMRIVDLSRERAVLAADIQELTGYMVDVIE